MLHGPDYQSKTTQTHMLSKWVKVHKNTNFEIGRCPQHALLKSPNGRNNLFEARKL